MADIMEFIHPDVFRAAVEVIPARRATLNQRKQNAAIHKLQKCSGLHWITPETFSCLPDNAVSLSGALLLIFFCQCLLGRWRRIKGNHPVTCRRISRCMAPCRRVAHRIDKVLKRQNRRMRRWLFRLWLLYVILRFLVHRKMARIWKKCKNRGVYYFERMKNAYIKAALFIYRYSPFIRVSAVVIFLHLFMSGDVELHPGPQDQLTIRDLKTIKKAAWDARTKWMDIGLELDIIQPDLDEINADNRGDTKKCFMEMLTRWLKQVDPPPTWSALVAALQDPAIGEGGLAEEIESKYVHQCSKTSDVTDSGPATKSQEVSSTRNQIKLEEYAEELKCHCKAKARAPSDDTQWPPPVDDKHKVFRLEIVEAKRKTRRTDVESDWMRCKTIDDKVDEVVRQRAPIELKDIFSKIEDQPNVLMEGAPGSGKSTLSFHIRHEWAKGELFQDYKLVILIRLRDLIVQNAKSIADLLQDVIGEVAEEVMASKGEGTLFVLDGWDELPIGKPGHSVILDLIKGDELWKSSIITTSRPTSSAKLHQHVSLRAEILGFSKSELRSYFEFCLKDDSKDVNDLLKRIENNPIIEGICYLPLNTSILVHLFICGRGELPNTQYGIFSDLICNCIYRYLKKIGVDAVEIDSLDELPQSIDGQFQELCKLAYDGIMNDEVIFHLKPKPDFVTLDLLQQVESVGRRGMSYSYNFLHLSIQELLAAYHIATKLTDDVQAEKFEEMYNNPRFSAVFQFYAAITKLKIPDIKDVVVQVAKAYAVDDEPNRTDKALLLSLLHCLYEAQDSSLCKLVADQLKSKLKLGHVVDRITLSLAECFSLQYFLKHLENFDVDLKSCSIDGDKCKVLFKPDQVYPIKSLDLRRNSLGDEGAHIVSEAMKTMKNLQHLNLYKASIGDKGIVDILSVVKTMTTLQSLDIGGNSIEAKGAVSIAEAMDKTPNLQQFELGLKKIGREAALRVLTAMKTMATLPCIDLSYNSLGEDGAAALCKILKTMSNLHYLDLFNNKIGSEGGVALSEALRGMTNLQYLGLSYNKIGSEGGVALSEALRGMTNLQHLDLYGNAIGTEVHVAVALSVAVETMSNLQHLNLGANDIDDEGAVAISSPLMKMSSLQTLVLHDNPIGDRGAEALATAMKTMNLQTLTFGYGSRCSYEKAMMVLAAIRTMSNMKDLDFWDLPLGDDGAKAILEAVKVMPNLQELLVTNKEGTSISEVGEQALREARELVEARRKVDHYYS